MKFYTQYNPKPCIAEKFTLPSETVPDETMSIQEIIARYVKYGTLPSQRASDGGGNESFEPEFDPLDHNPEEFIVPQFRKSEERNQEPVAMSADAAAPDPVPAATS